MELKCPNCGFVTERYTKIEKEDGTIVWQDNYMTLSSETDNGVYEKWNCKCGCAVSHYFAYVRTTARNNKCQTVAQKVADCITLPIFQPLYQKGETTNG